MGLWVSSRVAATCIVVLALAALLPSQAAAQPRVNADAQALASLQDRVREYMALHNKLEGTLPGLPKDATPQQIDVHQRAFAALVQAARRGAKRGDLFTPEARRVIRQLMNRVFGGPDGRQLRASVMDENPGRLLLTVNSRYPDTVPLSTVPPQVLAGLPTLPEELEFRFIGRRLILMDVHAHIILDFIDNAIPA
jgi:hypothetical protein